jgi:hypothetical protein
MKAILNGIHVKSQPVKSTDISPLTQTERSKVPTVGRQAPSMDALKQVPPLNPLTPPPTHPASSKSGNLPSHDCQAIPVHVPQQAPTLNHLSPIAPMLPAPIENNDPQTGDLPDVPIESQQQDVPRNSLAPIPPVPPPFKSSDFPPHDIQAGPVDTPYQSAPEISPPSERSLLPKPPSVFRPIIQSHVSSPKQLICPLILRQRERAATHGNLKISLQKSRSPLLSPFQNQPLSLKPTPPTRQPCFNPVKQPHLSCPTQLNCAHLLHPLSKDHEGAHGNPSTPHQSNQ